eukprot:augustus_masked-scaffold_9-processed-gene-9.50-mRNA-1 protein AED:0.43 eAED:0.44 QI:0/-1/0/1/-1/1/1/0/113
MKYLSAYMLLSLSGKAAPTADEVKNVLGSVEAEVEEEQLSLIMGKLEGKEVDALIEAGEEKLVALGGAGGGGAGAGGAADGAAAAEEEKVEEEEEEVDMGGGGALFGDDGDGY